MSNLDQSISHLTTEAMIFGDKMDKCSESIKKVEESLKLLNINLPFYFSFTDSNDRKYGISWTQHGEKEEYRLCSERLDDIKARKPLIEQKLGLRLTVSTHLVDFVNAFKEHIKQIRINIEESGI